VHFHALGDRAVREALDAVEAARARTARPTGGTTRAPAGRRGDRDRPFAELDAVANIQALWATHEDQIDELTLPFLQDGAEARQYPFGDLVRHGARLARGSDWPVSSADPMDAIHIAVTRVAPGRDDEPLGGAHQRLDLATAMAAYTSAPPDVNHRDHDTGHVREGYLANLVVLDPTRSPSRRRDPPITVESTWIEGELVHSAH
jgi:predicted amidohydrolase YtcJ